MSKRKRIDKGLIASVHGHQVVRVEDEPAFDYEAWIETQRRDPHMVIMELTSKKEEEGEA